MPYRTAADQLTRLVETGSLKTGKRRSTLPIGHQGLVMWYWR